MNNNTWNTQYRIQGAGWHPAGELGIWNMENYTGGCGASTGIGMSTGMEFPAHTTQVEESFANIFRNKSNKNNSLYGYVKNNAGYRCI